MTTEDIITIEVQIKSMIQNELSYHDIVLNHDKFIEDLGADSLEMICLAMECEKYFNIKIDEAEVDLIETVGEFIELVKSKI